MYLYLVTYDPGVGWDEFNGFVVKAMNPEDAKIQAEATTHGGQGGPSNWRAKKIGTADSERRGVILGSFNAG